MEYCAALPRLTIGSLSSLPIVQGGMGIGVSMSSLASAVAEAGAVGVLSAIGAGFLAGARKAEEALEVLRQEIRKARAATSGVLGMNAMVASSNFADEVRVSAEEGVDILFAGAGLPMDLPGLLPPGSKMLLAPIVSSARAAKLLIARWTKQYQHPPDAIVVEGPKAGGHLGFKVEQLEDPAFQLERLVPQVAEEAALAGQQFGVRMPVIAAGGIYDGADMANMLSLGASAVQLGTRFAATVECDASPAFKQALVGCKQEDIDIIQSPVGMPGRAIIGDFLRKAREGLTKPARCLYHCLKTCKPGETPYCIGSALVNARQGNLDEGFVFTGTNGYRVNRVMGVKELIHELCEGYAAAERKQKEDNDGK